MIRTLQALSRLRPASVALPAFRCCGFASRNTNKPWVEQGHVYREMRSNRASKYGHEMSVEELESEDVEEKIQAVVKYVSVAKYLTSDILSFPILFEFITSFIVARREGGRRL